MRTSKPFATISYNTIDFLNAKCNELVKNNSLSFWCAIMHKKEDDEEKDHMHVYFIPNGTIDTDKLRDTLKQIDLNNPLPLGCMPCVSSKFNTWYYYSTHNKHYLASIGQSRKYSYEYDNLICSSSDYLRELVTTMLIPNTMKQHNIIEMIDNGNTPNQLLRAGVISIQQFGYWVNFYSTLQQCKTFRNGKPNHEPLKVDENGEILNYEDKTIT